MFLPYDLRPYFREHEASATLTTRRLEHAEEAALQKERRMEQKTWKSKKTIIGVSVEN